jgi:DNA anti-recombination protein RmuC
MSTREADSLLEEFKSVIKEITVEVAKQTVVQDIKRSEEVMRHSATTLEPVASSLQASAGKLEEVIRTNAAELRQQFADLESRVSARLEQLEDKNRAAVEELTEDFRAGISNLIKSMQETAEAYKKMSGELIENVLAAAEEERARAKNAREWMFALFAIQIVLIIAVPAFWNLVLN